METNLLGTKVDFLDAMDGLTRTGTVRAVQYDKKKQDFLLLIEQFSNGVMTTRYGTEVIGRTLSA